MKKRQIVLTSSIAVALFLGSYSSVASANYDLSSPSIYLQAPDVSVIGAEQEDVGVSAGDFREDLGIDPTFSVSLASQGFSPSQIQKIFTSASLKRDYNKMPLGE
jgi:hypothetical protein